MTKVRPCKKSCGYPALKGRQFCRWHALMRMSSQEQAQWAVQRALGAARLGELGYRARVPKEEWPNGERWCAGCQSFVPVFYTSGSRCKACASSASHSARILDTYGLSAEEYDRLFRLQGGRCAICRNKSRTIRLAVDHDHQTQAVRGLLCKRCNHDLLGGGHDSIDMLLRAIAYLLFPPAQRREAGAVPPDEQLIRALEGHLASKRAARRNLPEQKPPPF